jgi:hypothetical protein
MLAKRPKVVLGVRVAFTATLLASCSASYEHHFTEHDASAGDAQNPRDDGPAPSDGPPRADTPGEPDATPRPDVSADAMPDAPRADVTSPDVALDSAPQPDGTTPPDVTSPDTSLPPDGTPSPDAPAPDTAGPIDAPPDLIIAVDAQPDAPADVDAGCIDPAACAPGTPRLLTPHSTGFATAFQPTLKWTAAAKASSYRLEVCFDNACTNVHETINTAATSAQLTTALPPRSACYWRVTALNDAFSATSRTWTFTTLGISTGIDTSWLGTADFDGDTYRDVALGGNNQVLVLRSDWTGGGGLPTTPQTEINGTNGFGTFVSYAGDVNGDGRGDLIASSKQNDYAKLLFGTSTGLNATPQTLGSGTTTMLQFVTGLGDVNGDGYADVAVGEGTTGFQWRIYYGADSGALPAGESLGSCADFVDFDGDGVVEGCPAGGAGDVNADGFADIVMCSRTSKTATVFLRNASGTAAAQTIPMPAGETTFGEACVGAGDVNSDGYADVMVATQATAKVYLFLGNPSGIQTTAIASVAGPGGANGVTTSIAAAGDVNRDGFGDIIVGGAGGNSVIVFHGGGSGTLTVGTQFASLPAGGGYGRSVAAVGDGNGDGYDDIAFAPTTCMGHSIRVQSGGSSGVSSGPPFLQWTAPATGSGCLVIAR